MCPHEAVSYNNWTQEDEMILAECVLRHLRQGNSEKHAFEEVSENLKRNVSEIANVWEHNLSERYSSAIEIANKASMIRKYGPTSISQENKTKVKEQIEEKTNQTEDDEDMLNSATKNYDNKSRQDAWTSREDRLLADTVLHYIRTGGTQLEAFEEVGDKLNRTSAAVGFRWNACVRREIENEIENAKRERIQRQKREKIQKKQQSKEVEMSTEVAPKVVSTPSPSKETPTNNNREVKVSNQSEMTIDGVIQFLQGLKQNGTSNKEVEEERDYWKEKFEKLEKEHEEVKSDLQVFSQILDRARKISS